MSLPFFYICNDFKFILITKKRKQMLQLITAENFEALISDITARALIILLCWGVMVAAVFIDLWSGVDAAKACGEKIQSSGLRRTVSKLGDYFRIELFFLMFDGLGAFITWYELPYASILGAFSIIFIEGKSVIENSRKKHSSAANIPDVMRQIINASNIEQAKAIVEKLNDVNNDNNN